jgi:hypothetical protein
LIGVHALSSKARTRTEKNSAIVAHHSSLWQAKAVDTTARMVRRQLPAIIAVAAVLFMLATVVVAERLHTADQPPDRDLGGYAVIAHEMLRGRPLYTDLWDRKPPLLYLTFAAAERTVGYGPHEILLVNVVASLAMLLACFAAGWSGGGGPVAGLAAAVLWTAVGGDLLAQANQPNGEVFVNLAMTAAFALALGWTGRPSGRMIRACAIGALFAIATLYKQHAIVACAAVAAGHVIVPGAGASTWRGRLAESAVTATVIAFVWAAVFARFAAVGRLDAAFDDMVLQNLGYAGASGGGSIVGNVFRTVFPAHLFAPAMGWAIAPLALILAAALRRRAWPPAAQLWAFWAAGTGVVVAAPGYFLSHYYQLWMPPLCVAGGWAVRALLGPGPSRPLRTAVAALGLGAAAARQAADYRLTPEQWSRRGFPDVVYFDNDFARHRDVGRRLATLLRPGETFWNMGSDVALYFVADRSPPTGLLYFDPFVVGVDTRQTMDRLMVDLGARPPDLIVVSMRTFRALPASAPIFPWMRANYDAVPAQADFGRPPFRLFVRRGTDLHRRMIPATTRPTTR